MNFTDSQVVNSIVASLLSGVPFLLGRYGHCESRVLGFDDRHDRSEVDKSLSLQFGNCDLTNEDLLKIQVDLFNAVVHTDILGIPTNVKVKNDLDELWAEIPSILERKGFDIENTIKCSPNFHIHALEGGLLPQIIKPAERIILITGRNIRDEFCSSFDKKFVDILLVPQEARTNHRSLSQVTGPHYPDSYYRIHDKLCSMDLSGALCLYGAGFLGKSYGAAAKRSGAVSVDIGSVFDAWAGVMGRSFMNKHYLKKYAINGYVF